MFFIYYKTSRKSPTVVDLPGTSESEKNLASAYILVSAYIDIKFDDCSISPDESGVYAEIYSDDGIKLSELHRVGNDSWDWVNCNTFSCSLTASEPEDPPGSKLIDSFEEFHILSRLAHSLKDADLYYLADLLCYDLDQLHDDIEYFLNFSQLYI